MKSKALKMFKTMTLLAVAFVIVTVGSLSTTIGASATETVASEVDAPEGNGVIYVEYSNMDYSEYWGIKAPKYSGVDDKGIGYFFGGWYTKDNNTYTPVTEQDGLTGTVVAKFVPAQTMSVKCQNWAGTNASSDDVIIRVISATDNLNYRQFGFQVSIIRDGVEGKLSTFTTDTVYKKFNYYESQEDQEPTPYLPSQLFGDAAARFTTCTVGKVPVGEHGTIICIKPFWVTLDDVKVYGLSKFAHVEDGYLGYVNVPVNLNILSEDSVAAAGVLSVKSDDSLTFIGAENGIECGKVFDEMKFNVLSDGTIKCVGNTSDISEKEEMDVYVNLRFQRKDTDSEAPIANEFYTFTVDEEDFCDRDEKQLEKANVWNIIY